MPAALVRRLTPADAAAHRALMLEAYAQSPDAFTSTVDEREGLPLSWWAARMSEGPGASELVCGAFDGEELVGAAGLSFEQRERTRHKAILFGLYVRPAARGQGVARRLVDAVLDEARSSPLTEVVQLTVTESNSAAVQLYTRCGFVPFGSEPLAVRLDDRFVTKLHLWQRIARVA